MMPRARDENVHACLFGRSGQLMHHTLILLSHFKDASQSLVKFLASLCHAGGRHLHCALEARGAKKKNRMAGGGTLAEPRVAAPALTHVLIPPRLRTLENFA